MSTIINPFPDLETMPAPDQAEDEHKRRWALWSISPEILLSLGSGTFEVVASPLPPDARMVGAFYDEGRGIFSIVVESETFEEVAANRLLPFLMPPVIRRVNP